MNQKSPNFYIPALTGYRAIAAWMIFVLHFFPFKNPAFPQFLKNFISEWHIGVDMFFVLSGFLIAFRYFDQQPIDFKKYMVNRFARIYPMYFIITAGVFLAFIIQNETWNNEKTIEAILSFTMTKALFKKYFFAAGISQGWTLTLEELFYITAPLYFILIRKAKMWLWILPITIFIFGTTLKILTDVPSNTVGFLQDNIAVFIFEFFVGIALALFIKKNREFRFKVKGGVTYFGMTFILLYLLYNPFSYASPDYIRAIQVILLSVLGIVPLLWGLIFEDTPIKRFLSTKYLVLLGKSSYIFYLIHKGFIPIFIYDYIAENVLLIFIIINILSILMYHYIEEPLNGWIRKKYAQKSASQHA